MMINAATLIFMTGVLLIAHAVEKRNFKYKLALAILIYSILIILSEMYVIPYINLIVFILNNLIIINAFLLISYEESEQNENT